MSRGEDASHDPLGHPALTDPVTELPNRLHFEAVFRILYEAGDRGYPLVLLLLDVGTGPDADAPDAVLRRIGARLGATTRRTDLVARVGARRFGTLLIDSNLHGGRIAADRILETLESLDIPDLRAGIGMAAYRGGLTGREAMMAAAGAAAEEALGRPEEPVRTAD